MKLIIFGPPGAGKGTCSVRIAHVLGIANISTGDIFRNHIAKGTELGEKVKSYVQNGVLVPDEIVIDIMKRRRAQLDCEKGFILDGYPRTLNQAKALKNVQIDAIINLIVPDEILVAKCVARRICEDCGDIYSVLNLNTIIASVRYILPSINPNIEGKCDKCGGNLVRRIDDNAEIVKTRLGLYKEQSKPVTQYYRDRVPHIEIYVKNRAEIILSIIIEKLTTLTKKQ